MKLKSMLFVLCFSLFANAFAANLHTNPNAQNAPKAAAGEKSPGYCEIEIVNNSWSDVRVTGTFDDGAYVDFMVYAFEAPHYINLYYYGYCHSGMYLTLSTWSSIIYDRWTPTSSTIRINSLASEAAKGANKDEVKAELSTK